MKIPAYTMDGRIAELEIDCNSMQETKNSIVRFGRFNGIEAAVKKQLHKKQKFLIQCEYAAFQRIHNHRGIRPSTVVEPFGHVYHLGDLMVISRRVSPGEEYYENAQTMTLLDKLKASRDALEGLMFCHSIGIVHRDVKPANMLKGKDNYVLVDFGSIMLDGRHIYRKSEFIQPGTPLYISPEQAIKVQYSDPIQIDESADIYSWAAGMYDSFVLGNFLGTTDEIEVRLKKITGKHSADEESLKKLGIPESLAEVIILSLSKDRDERPDKKTIMDELERAISSY